MEAISSHHTDQPNDISQPRIARMGDRVFAVFLDFWIQFPLVWVGGAAVALRYGFYHDDNWKMTGDPALLAILLDTLIWIAYHTITEFFFAGTPGKHLMGIAVQSQQYTRCTLRQSLVRNVIRPFDAIGFYALGFIVAVSTKRHLRIGDLCAKTVVTEQTDSERLRALAVFVLCLICSFALAFAFTHFAGSK